MLVVVMGDVGVSVSSGNNDNKDNKNDNDDVNDSVGSDDVSVSHNENDTNDDKKNIIIKCNTFYLKFKFIKKMSKYLKWKEI